MLDFLILCYAFYLESNITTYMETLHSTAIVVVVVFVVIVVVVVVVVVYGVLRASIVARLSDSCISYHLLSPV